MKIRIMKNSDLDEPYVGLARSIDIFICEDGYIYAGDTSGDPIDQGDWDNWDAGDEIEL